MYVLNMRVECFDIGWIVKADLYAGCFTAINGMPVNANVEVGEDGKYIGRE
jgi:hypothetical protein